MLIKLLIGVALCAALVPVARLAVARLSNIPVAHGVVEEQGHRRLGPCPDTPNCASEHIQLSNHEPAAIMQRISSLLESESGVRVVTQSSDYWHSVWKTRMMGYLDDVEFLIDPELRLLHIRSASRLGHSDLGANARRIEAIRQQLKL